MQYTSFSAFVKKKEKKLLKFFW